MKNHLKNLFLKSKLKRKYCNYEIKYRVTEEKPMVARSGLPRIPAKRNKDKIVLRKYDSNENYKYEGEESFLKFR